jgi:hypothetical protein
MPNDTLLVSKDKYIGHAFEEWNWQDLLLKLWHAKIASKISEVPQA